jgi:hypothetical protein
MSGHSGSLVSRYNIGAATSVTTLVSSLTRQVTQPSAPASGVRRRELRFNAVRESSRSPAADHNHIVTLVILVHWILDTTFGAATSVTKLVNP